VEGLVATRSNVSDCFVIAMLSEGWWRVDWQREEEEESQLA
jgi:hypothetical protein